MWELLRGHTPGRTGVGHRNLCTEPKVAMGKPRLWEMILER